MAKTEVKKRNFQKRDGIKFTYLNREYIACSGNFSHRLGSPSLKYNAISYGVLYTGKDGSYTEAAAKIQYHLFNDIDAMIANS